MTQGELFSRFGWVFVMELKKKTSKFQQNVLVFLDQWEFLSVGKLTSLLPQLIKIIHFQPNTYLQIFLF